MDEATIKETLNTVVAQVKILSTAMLDLIDRYTTKSTRDLSATRDGANTQYNAYAQGRYIGPGFDVNAYNELVVAREKEEYTGRAARRQQLQNMGDLAYYAALKHTGALDEATVSKIKDIQQTAARGDDNTGSTDKFADERQGKNEANIDTIKEQIMSQMQKLNSLVDSLNLEKVAVKKP